MREPKSSVEITLNCRLQFPGYILNGLDFSNKEVIEIFNQRLQKCIRGPGCTTRLKEFVDNIKKYISSCL